MRRPKESWGTPRIRLSRINRGGKRREASTHETKAKPAI